MKILSIKKMSIIKGGIQSSGQGNTSTLINQYLQVTGNEIQGRIKQATGQEIQA